MDWCLHSKMLQQTVFAVSSSGESQIKLGSGVLVNDRFGLITAGHVASRRKNDQLIPATGIYARTSRATKLVKYKVISCGYDIMLPHFRKPIYLDIAYIEPAVAASDRSNYLRLHHHKVDVGTPVLMGGYPEDVRLPFQFPMLLDDNDEVVKETFDEVIESNRRPMLKHGIVGNVEDFKFTVDDKHVSGQIIAIDNYMASGASGGAVINGSGNLLGIIIEGTEIYSEVEGGGGLQLPVPSGATYAITCETLMTIKEFLRL